MRKRALLTLLTALWMVTASPAARPAQAGSISIYTVAACRDTVTVSVSGNAGYATNRVKLGVFVQDTDGKYKLRQEGYSSNFGSGDFLLSVLADFSDRPVSAGRALRLDVTLQRQSGSGFANVTTVSYYTTAVDQLCKNRCALTLSTSDKAPANGTVTVRSHYGSFFRPEGRLHAILPVTANRPIFSTIVSVPCDWTVRAWYYPASGKDLTPRLLPSQYWPGEFGVSLNEAAIPYTTAFAKGVPATAPLESNDQFAPKK